MKDSFDVFMEEEFEEDDEENTVLFSYIPEIDDAIAEPTGAYEDLDDELNDIDF